jgi:hypothetical protein
VFEDPSVSVTAGAGGPCVWGWSVVRLGFGPLPASRMLRNAARMSGTMLRDPPVTSVYPTWEFVASTLLPVREWDGMDGAAVAEEKLAGVKDGVSEPSGDAYDDGG